MCRKKRKFYLPTISNVYPFAKGFLIPSTIVNWKNKIPITPSQSSHFDAWLSYSIRLGPRCAFSIGIARPLSLDFWNDIAHIGWAGEIRTIRTVSRPTRCARRADGTTWRDSLKGGAACRRSDARFASFSLCDRQRGLGGGAAISRKYQAFLLRLRSSPGGLRPQCPKFREKEGYLKNDGYSSTF